MCGWCIESIALNILEKERSGRFPRKECCDEMGRWFYLREDGDFPKALKRMKQSLVSKKSVPLEQLPAEVILLRSLEILVKDGFTSPSYQQLVRQELIRDLIVRACAAYPQSAFVEATRPLDILPLAPLYDSATYLTEDGAQVLRQLSSLVPACRKMLSHYHSWWLRGEGLRKKDLAERMERSEIFDPIEDTGEDEHELFYLLLRATYFSVLLVGHFPAGSNMLRQLATQSPACVPWFYGDDLWVQRVAALALYDLIGFDNFLEYLPDFRATIFYYIDLRRAFTPEQKRRLQDEAHLNREICRNDDFMTIEDWLSETAGC